MAELTNIRKKYVDFFKCKCYFRKMISYFKCKTFRTFYLVNMELQISLKCNENEY